MAARARRTNVWALFVTSFRDGGIGVVRIGSRRGCAQRRALYCEPATRSCRTRSNAGSFLSEVLRYPRASVRSAARGDVDEREFGSFAARLDRDHTLPLPGADRELDVLRERLLFADRLSPTPIEVHIPLAL